MSLANVNVRFGVDMREFSTKMQNASRKLKKFGSQMTSTGQSLSMKLTAPLVGMAALSVKAFDQQARAVAQVEAGLRSTGNAVGYTSDQLQKMASELQNNSLFGDEEILQGVTAQLLTFTNIAGSEFAKTQQVALDLATRLDGDLKSASIMLGKALNDPVANLSALSRAGIQFSDEQKAMVKEMVSTNRLADAQALILKELEVQYGGSAKAASEAGAGGMKQFSMAIGDIMETFGEVIVDLLKPLTKWLMEAKTKFEGLSYGTRKMIVIIAALAAAIGPLLLVIGLMSTAMAALSAAFSPITLTILAVIAAVAALAAAGIYMYQNWDAITQKFSNLWIGLKNKVLDIVASIIEGIGKLFGPLGFGLFESGAAYVRGLKSDLPNEADAIPFKSFGKTISDTADMVFGSFDKIQKKAVVTSNKVVVSTTNAANGIRKAYEPIINLQQKLFKNVGPDGKPPKLFHIPTEEEKAKLDEMILSAEKQNAVTQAITSNVAGLAGAFEGFYTTLVDGGKNAFGAVIDYLKRLVIQLVAAATVAFLLSTLLGGVAPGFKFKELFFGLSGIDLPGRANGGMVFSNKAYMVGERGPELFVPSSTGNIMNNDALGKRGKGGVLSVQGDFALRGNTLVTGFKVSKDLKDLIS